MRKKELEFKILSLERRFEMLWILTGMQEKINKILEIKKELEDKPCTKNQN